MDILAVREVDAKADDCGGRGFLGGRRRSGASGSPHSASPIPQSVSIGSGKFCGNDDENEKEGNVLVPVPHSASFMTKSSVFDGAWP